MLNSISNTLYHFSPIEGKANDKFNDLQLTQPRQLRTNRINIVNNTYPIISLLYIVYI